MSPRLPLREVRVVLGDGTRALIRPVRPDDKERLQTGLARLSRRSRYLRFHTEVDGLTDEQLRYLTEVDQRDHAAWAALDEDRPEVPGIGVARYVRLPDEPAVAEAAITVADRYQGRGLGTVLLGILARHAQDNGIELFRNHVLAENETMIALLEQMGATRQVDAPGVYRLDMPLPEDPDEIPEAAVGRLLRAAAGDRLRLVLSKVIPIRLPDSDADGPRDRPADRHRPPAGELEPMLRDWFDRSEEAADDDLGGTVGG